MAMLSCAWWCLRQGSHVYLFSSSCTFQFVMFWFRDGDDHWWYLAMNFWWVMAFAVTDWDLSVNLCFFVLVFLLCSLQLKLCVYLFWSDFWDVWQAVVATWVCEMPIGALFTFLCVHAFELPRFVMAENLLWTFEGTKSFMNLILVYLSLFMFWGSWIVDDWKIFYELEQPSYWLSTSIFGAYPSGL